jgi:hypothetical protein
MPHWVAWGSAGILPAVSGIPAGHTPVKAERPRADSKIGACDGFLVVQEKLGKPNFIV